MENNLGKAWNIPQNEKVGKSCRSRQELSTSSSKIENKVRIHIGDQSQRLQQSHSDRSVGAAARVPNPAQAPRKRVRCEAEVAESGKSASGRAELRALKEGRLASCRFRRSWYRFRMRPDASGCVPDASRIRPGYVRMRRDASGFLIPANFGQFCQNSGKKLATSSKC